MKKVYFLLMLIIVSLSLQAQQKYVTGTVTDSSDGPIPGVNVVVKGSKIGTVTDLNGKFSLAVPPQSQKLVFTFIGFKSQEVDITKKSSVSVQMESESVGLDEVVAIGYGTMKKRDLTGSVVSVNMTDLNKAPMISFDSSIGGKVAGVQVTMSDGQPGSVAEIVIRGNNSVTQGNEPLYVIDGFPMENNNNSSINPADIASIEVLKDASATAIYGARGANGVIIVTTKRGQEGAPKIQYDAYYGVQQDYNRTELMSPYEFVKLQDELDGSYGAMYLENLGRTLDYYKDVKGINWQDLIFREALQQSHSISMSGGNKSTKYSTSFSYLDQNGIVINSGYKRYQSRITLDQQISNSISVGLNANYSSNKREGLIVNSGEGSNSFMYSVWAYRPVVADESIDLRDLLEDPEIGNGPARTNPYIEASNRFSESTSNSLMANGFVSMKILKSLTLRSTIGISSISTESNEFNNSKTRSGSKIPGNTQGVNGSRRFGRNNTITNENTLTYKTEFAKKHKLTALAGYTHQSNKASYFEGKGTQIENEAMGIDGLDEALGMLITSATSSEWALHSFLARSIYSYDSRYDLTLSARADGSSRFTKANRWGYFYSGALAWRISRERLLKDFKWLNDAKLRIGYGTTGNNNVGNYSYLAAMAFSKAGGTSYDYSFGNQVPSMGGVVYSVGNSDLKWETTGQFNAGLDISLFKSRLNFTADVYNKTTSDLLIYSDLPGSTGFPKAYRNVGKVGNKGLELTLGTVNITKPNFKWSTDFNIAFNRNKVLGLADGQESMLTQVNGGFLSQYIAKVGNPIGMFYGMVTEGLYQYDDFIQASDGSYILKTDVQSQSTTGNRTGVLPGYQKFKDMNNDRQITLDDMTIIGNPNPDFTGGFTNNFQYKGFDLNLFFSYSYGNDILNMSRYIMEEGRSNSTNQFASYANRWTVDNTDTDIPRVRSTNNTNWMTDRVIEDGSYLRLKNVTLGYSLPKALIKKLYLNNLRVYSSVQNLWTWTKYSGQDPTVSVRNEALTPGYDYSAYPVPRYYAVGLSATF